MSGLWPAPLAGRLNCTPAALSIAAGASRLGAHGIGDALLVHQPSACPAAGSARREPEEERVDAAHKHRPSPMIISYLDFTFQQFRMLGDLCGTTRPVSFFATELQAPSVHTSFASVINNCFCMLLEAS